jgi:hypothetical protein
MENRIFRFLIHPLFIYAIIAFLEIIPFRANSKEVILFEMPKVGDNFRVSGSETVYYYSSKGKYSYPSLDCYFSYGNPTFDIDYQDGGVKTIDKVIANKIPLLGSMCESEKKTVREEKQKSFFTQYFSINFLLLKFSEIAHVLFYMLFAFFTVFQFRALKHTYSIVFLVCFLSGAFLEFIQFYFVPGRYASWEDQALNTIGLLAGMLFFRVFGRTKILLPLRHLK